MFEKWNKGAGCATRPSTVIGVAALSALLGFLGVYVSLGGPDNVASIATVDAGAARTAWAGPGRGAEGTPADGPSTGAMTAFVLRKVPQELPNVAFVDGNGEPTSLADFRGKTVLLNLWATWCAPCREEMPSLDRLEKELGSDRFEVVALAVDRTGIESARKFMQSLKVQSLKLYADPTARSAPALKAVGMPTTILIGTDGREIGRLPGPAEWDSAAAKRLVEAALR